MRVVTAKTKVKVHYKWVEFVQEDQEMGYSFERTKLVDILPDDTDMVEEEEAKDLPKKGNEEVEILPSDRILYNVSQIQNYNQVRLKLILRRPVGVYTIKLKFLE